MACNRERPEDAFDRKKKILNRVVMNRSCRECIEQVRKRKRDDPRAQACQAWWNEYKKQPCSECGIIDSTVMEADHVRDRGKKLENLSLISFWVSHGGVEGMEREGRKCQPLCRFCHALKSFRERTEDRARQIFSCTKKAMASRERRASRQAYVNEIKQTVGKCIDCGRKVQEGNEAGFDFMHRSRSEKGRFAGCQADVSMLVKQGAARRRIDEEVEKCDLGCANCHKHRTIRELRELEDR